MTFFSGFGELDLSLDGFIEEEPDTVPVAGSAELEIEDKSVVLFVSAEWTLIARVGAVELGRSTTREHPHTDAFTKRWARQLIRSNRARLRRLGVDVPATYVRWGGILEDLEE